MGALSDKRKLSKLIDEVMEGYGYKLRERNSIGCLYVKLSFPAVFLDVDLYSKKSDEYQYIDYTSYQNKLMHHYKGLYRFLVDSNAKDIESEIKLFTDEVELFLGAEENTNSSIRIYGQNRAESHIDPTPPEYHFTEFFAEVYGEKYFYALEAESKYIDCRGHTRYVDFLLKRCNTFDTKFYGDIAIELNGERYHHPLFTQKKQYRSQLFKQNSLIYDGYLVYRWSLKGMADEYKFKEQMRNYFGDSQYFKRTPQFLAQRELSFKLYKHQEDAVESLNYQRQLGKNTFLVVLPTGTGKTEVFIQDLAVQIEKSNSRRALAIVPSTALKKQLQMRISLRLPNLSVGEDFNDHSLQLTVQTSAYLIRHYQNLSKTEFDYILVDEAHKAAATGLRKVIEYFQTKTLLGLTATDERLDGQELQDIFGKYSVDLTLEQAIAKGLAPQIRCYRLKSNIDLSQVRFNGKDYVKADLNKTLLVPSRDQLIVDLINKYFSTPLLKNQTLKQGVIFCTDIKHAKRMAQLMQKNGISAKAVHGKDRNGIEAYHRREIRFLCACDLLNEGWDAPQTEILVMARPTMSKVLYSQQLGRGTRKYNGKEALIVIDVVDSYGSALQPWSVHSLFNLSEYQPFSDIISTEKNKLNDELIVLDNLWEGERKIEKINIFNFEKEFGDLLSEEQLARELFISTSTVKKWINRGEIYPSKTHPFGNKVLNYFSQNQLTAIRKEKNIKERTEATRRDDFFEFLEKRDYAFSYKIFFLLSFITLCDEHGEVKLSKLVKKYQSYYVLLFKKYGKLEKARCPFNEEEKLNDISFVSRNLMQNPFEKFERKRFIYHSKDLNIVAFDPILWEQLTQKCIDKIKSQMTSDIKDYFKNEDIILSDLL